MNYQDSIIFEICWEACNKIGGIYTVIASKAVKMKELFQDNYFIIGPYFMDKAKGEFQETVPPAEVKSVLIDLGREGINCHWGKWLIRGEPTTLLIDFHDYFSRLNDIKGQLWEKFKIDSLNSSFDFDEPVLWAWCVGEVIDRLKDVFKNKQIIAHSHEWLSGSALLYLKEKEPQIKKVFTTHATVLGRSLAAVNYPLYEAIETIDVNKKAYELNVAAKHQLERAIAQNTDILTTVSEITDLEVEHFLGRKSDILLPNGLNLDKNLTFEDISVAHRLQRDRMREFLLYYFFPYYSFDLRESLFYFISGRYEFHNKGIDIFIDALADLNRRLKEQGDRAKTIIVFFLVPTVIRGINLKIREAREVFTDVEQTLEESRVTTESNLLYNIMAEAPLSTEVLFEEDTLRKLKRKLLRLKQSSGLPPICAHDLVESNNDLLKRLQEKDLINKPDDKVKVVFYPAYLTGSDGLLNISYDECVQGSHLGVFPSYYEPWGYTPLETAAFGVATVTTDLAGFGRFMKPFLEKKRFPGIFLMERYKKTYEESIKQLSDILYQYTFFSYYERVQNKINASDLAQKASWDNLIKYYEEAYSKAIGL